MRSVQRKIPSFSLYGEGGVPGGMSSATHVEDIPSRSKKYLWQIAAHRHQDLAQCVIVTAGPVTATLEGIQSRFRGPAAILVPAGTVHAFRFAADTTGFVLTVNLIKLLSHVGASQHESIEALLSVPRAVELHFAALFAERIASLLECLLREYRRPERLPEATASALAVAVLSTVADGCNCAHAAPGRNGAEPAPLRAFRALLEATYGQHWPVSRYARKLEISETTLNRICHRLTGHTAFNLIQRRLAIEAQRRLIYGGATVSGIARELGFKDLAYFCRFFRRHSGISPSQFRRRERKSTNVGRNRTMTRGPRRAEAT